MGKATTLRSDFGVILSGVIALTFSTAAPAHRHARSEPHRHATPSKAKGKTKPAHRDTHHDTRQDKATPAGVTTIPSAGLKVYCAGSKSPLLIRKSTQGNGTTVTVICR